MIAPMPRPAAILLALLSLLPGMAAAQQLRTVLVPADAEVVIAARGAPQPRLVPRQPTALPPGPTWRTPSSLFESPDADLPFGGAGMASALSLGAVAAIAATLGSGLAGRGSGGTGAPARTR